MGYYDQHMHTHFSPDSAESFENYLEQTDGLLVTTEHLDFHDAYNGGVDTVLDYAAYSDKIDALNAIHDGRIRRGIEVGYTPESHARIMSYLEGKTFDVILLSVHQNGRYDYLQPIIDEIIPKRSCRNISSSVRKLSDKSMAQTSSRTLTTGSVACRSR